MALNKALVPNTLRSARAMARALVSSDREQRYGDSRNRISRIPNHGMASGGMKHMEM